MSLGLAYWILMLIWLIVGIAWHFAWVGVYGGLGFALIPFLLLALLGRQVFGPPLR